MSSTKNNSNNNNKRKNPPTKGVDKLLAIRCRPLKPGESVRFRLVKGPAVETNSGDPVDSTAPPEQFPLVAKFGESVQRPDFQIEKWRTARLYQQEVPKPVEDSDEEDEKDGNAPKKRRWRYAGDSVVPRQWILQENVDFLQTMVDRKEQAAAAAAAAAGVVDGDNCTGGDLSSQKKNQLSSRYEGMPENNPSQYALVRLHPSTRSPNDAKLQLCLLPHAPQNFMINFAQPATRKSYSLTEAEHVITDQRMGLVKTFHHMHPTSGGAGGGGSGAGGGVSVGDGTNGGAAGEGGDAAPPPQPRNILALRKKVAQSSKGRLLSKLQTKAKAATAAGVEEDGDDVMGDVAFRNRKGGGGGGGAARKELLQIMSGDGGLMVSDEGVLGGTNDAMFGGRQRFAQLSASNDNNNNDNKDWQEKTGGDDANVMERDQPVERGADGAAMEEDFYQRDVKAEYDELDYDASEQFDDDDVDLGEGEVVVENSGFAGDDVDEDEDEDELGLDEDVKGAEGLASLAGFKALLAKARGETVPEPETNAPSQNNNKNDNGKKKKVDHMSKIMAAAEQSRLAAEKKAAKQNGRASASAEPMELERTAPASSAAAASAASPAAAAVAASSEIPLLDAQGLRIITLEAVRREIWLNHGSIPMKRLMKIFVVGKKSTKERRDRFLEIVKELCTMKADPINGNMLVLKQHYSKG